MSLSQPAGGEYTVNFTVGGYLADWTYEWTSGDRWIVDLDAIGPLTAPTGLTANRVSKQERSIYAGVRPPERSIISLRGHPTGLLISTRSAYYRCPLRVQRPSSVWTLA